MNASIILSGDHLQLEPGVLSQFAKNFGYQKSMMEHLMDQPLYQKESAYMVRLKRNYRSHEAILEPSNVLFYNKMLIAAASHGK